MTRFPTYLQQRTIEPAVDYALTAVGMVYRAAWFDDETISEVAHFSHVDQALQRMLNKNLSEDFFLITSLVLIQAEIIRGGDPSLNRAHLEHLENLLQVWKSSDFDSNGTNIRGKKLATSFSDAFSAILEHYQEFHWFGLAQES
jgi:hypothetical protein